MNYESHFPARPHAVTLEALKGIVSEPLEVLSNKPNSRGQVVKVALVKEGSGMIGLKSAADNQEWAGIFNHILKTARVATFLAALLRKEGEVVDSDCILNTILVSHAGRRQYDEATWYSSIVPDAAQKVEVGDTTITLGLLSHAHMPPVIIEGVKAHGVGATYPVGQMDTWEKILPAYADFRVSQHVMSLQERFDDLTKRGVAAGRFTQSYLKVLEEWAFQAERRIFSTLQMRPEGITDNNPSPPRWERYLRRLYINDAEKDIFANISQFYQVSGKETEFSDSWWGKYVRNLYESQRGIPYEQIKERRRNKAIGIERAIGVFAKLDSCLSL